MDYTQAYTAIYFGGFLIPERKVTTPGLFDLVEPLRGHGHRQAAIVDAFTGRCSGWINTQPDLFPSVEENAPTRR